jgi:hypothetical protein
MRAYRFMRCDCVGACQPANATPAQKIAATQSAAAPYIFGNLEFE